LAPPPLSALAPVCCACYLNLDGPLLLCECGCRLPLHTPCYRTLMFQGRGCPACKTSWSTNTATASVISVATTEAIVERPLSHTECVPQFSLRWMVYTMSCLVIIVAALFVFFYYTKQ
jgi:hypothetical protein